MPEHPYFIGLQLLFENQQIEDDVAIPQNTTFQITGIVMEGQKPCAQAPVTIEIAGVKIQVNTGTSGRFTAAFNSNARNVLTVGGPYPVSVECAGVCQKGQIQVEVTPASSQEIWKNDEDNTAINGQHYARSIGQRRTMFSRLFGRDAPREMVVATQQIITVWGTQGGVGTTSVSVLLARLIHEEDLSVILLELSPTGGSLLRFLGKRPAEMGLDTVIVKNQEEIYRIEQAKIPIVTGLNVIPLSGSKVSSSLSWDEETAQKLFDWARRQAAFVIVDAGTYREPVLARLALRQANWIVALARGTSTGVDAAIRFDTWCKAVGWEKVLWCVTQADTSIRSNFNYETGLRVCAELTNRRKEYLLLERGGAPQDGIRKDIEPLIKQILAAPKAKVF